MSLLGIIASSKLGIPDPGSPVAGYYAWYDAADTSTISLSGSNVTQWNDKSGNGYHLTQGTDSRRPQSGTRTMNTRNVLDYSENVDTLVASTAANWTFLSNSTGSTAFIVWEIDTLPSVLGNPFVFLFTRGGSTGDGPGYAVQISGATNGTLNAVNIQGDNICVNTSTSTSSVNTPVVWTIKSDPNNGTAADKSSIFKNSGSAEKNNVTTGTPSANTPVQPLRVGDYADGGTLGIDGKLAEIIIYSGILNATDTTTNIDYLKTKWGI
jgi:hypothetical protein